jgi:sulfopyruvate decarboxylase TPP-binding subunit
MMTAMGVPASVFITELDQLGLHAVVTVPDTHQRTLLAALAGDDRFRVITATTEDEGVGICAGLWWGGVDPLLLIQHAGVFASVNTLRGIGLDMSIPITMLVGLYGRDPAIAPEDSRGSMNRLVLPLLERLGVAYELIDGPDDLGALGRMKSRAASEGRPAAAVVGAETL